MTDQRPVHAFLCPYCADATYPTEMLTRVHVSYATDSVHEGHDGMTPEVEPVECDANGERLGTAFTLPGQLTPHALSIADIPTAYRGREFGERERRALLVAAYSANESLPDTELRDRVAAELAEHGHDPLPADRLRALCRHVFCPHTDEQSTDRSEITTAETTLRDLTTLQQAIVLGHLSRPATDPTDLARRLGTARSYPSRVVDTRSELVARLRSRLDGGVGLERLVAERVPAESLERIRDEGYLEAFEIDLAAAGRRKRGHAPDARGSPDPSPAAVTGEEPGDGHAVDDEPVTGDDRAATGDELFDGEAAGSTADDEHRQVVGRNEGRGSPTGGEERVPRAEVEAVREQVAFDLAVVEREMEMADPTPQQVRTEAYLQQILARLDEVLSRGRGD